MEQASDYHKMWEDFGADKSTSYLNYKFTPTHRVGLTNFLREQKLLQYLDPQKDDIVLDVGCAAGRQIFKLASQIKEGYGTDIAQSFIDKANDFKAKHNADNTHFTQAVIEELPFEDEKFTKIICAEVLEHVHDKDVALRELKRVLKTDGVLIITVPNYNADGTAWGRLLRKLGKRKFVSLEHFTKAELQAHGDAHVREFSAKTLENWVKEHDFKVESKTSVSYIDGPKFDFLLKIPLHIPGLQQLVISIDKLLSKLPIFWGRHLVFKVRKNG